MKISDIRRLIPAAGLKEYWYPALKLGSVGHKPVGRKLLGEDIVFFRGKSGEVVALANACPHRGGSLMEGDCHYAGTVACPYHGWVFDEDGECVAVLSEGPDSRIPGRVRARKFPTKAVGDLLFVWLGDGQPVPIEHDVPPEMFEGGDMMVFTAITHWPINWRVALENSLDSHVMYVHRNALIQLKDPIVQFGPIGNRARTLPGKACIGYMPSVPKPGREYYPKLDGWWPKREWRRLWLWAFRWNLSNVVKGWSDYPPFNGDEEWDMHTSLDGKRVRAGGHHLPSMFRFDFGKHMLTRICVPIDEANTQIVYYHAVRRSGAMGRALHRLYYYGFYRWAMYGNFSKQDLKVMATQRFDTPEHLSATDAEVAGWRQLLLKARGMPGHTATPPGGDESVPRAAAK
ncbi:MAG: Rieske 2Fe-2S domain-containing protein [Rhodospirillales bacterium]|nr:Rieske 2Fe-2S domain-containing protein [Rhodospirillales bacterium]